MLKGNKKSWKFLWSSLTLLLALTLVFSSFSFVFAYENGVEGYGENDYDGVFEDDDGYANDGADAHDDEYDNSEYDEEDTQDSLSQEMQKAEVIEIDEYGSGIAPAWNLSVMQESGRISAGADNSFVIMSDNSLWGFGANQYGQLGDGTIENRYRPVWIMDNVTAVSAGRHHTMAITTDGILWGWGANLYGQLGDSTTENRLNPIQIMDDVAMVSAGRQHTMAITTDGTLWGWGANWNGQLGNGTSTYWDAPSPNPIKIMENVVSVSAGWGHTMAITTCGSAWTWGGDVSHFHSPSWVWMTTDVAAISTNSFQRMLITTDGRLWGWGANCVGQLGDGTTISRDWPVWVMEHIVSVSARNSDFFGHTMAIRADGSLWGWGDNLFGQLGVSTSGEWAEPNPNPIKIMNNVAEVTTGMDHTLAITTDGYLWGWGSNWSGQLGHSAGHLQFYPVMIKSLTPTGNTPDPDRNLTHHYATMTASSSFNPVNTPPHNTNDNNTTANPWRPAAPGSGYLTARFNEAKNFNQIRIYQNGNRIRDYQLKYSNDGFTWNVLHSGTATAAAIATYPFGNTITAQYVRLVIGYSLNNNPAAIFQFDIRYMP